MNKFYSGLGIIALSLTLDNPAFSFACEKDTPQITDLNASNGCPLQISQKDMFDVKKRVYFSLHEPTSNLRIKEVQSWLNASTRQKIRQSIGIPTDFVLIHSEKLSSDLVSCTYRINKALTSSEYKCVELQHRLPNKSS